MVLVEERVDYSHIAPSGFGTADMVIIGHDANGAGILHKVGETKNLSSPGVIFRYASYVREQEGLLSYYLQCYHKNLSDYR